MFCHITENWLANRRESAVIVNLIGNTKTRTGLTINAELDEKRVTRQASKVSDAELAAVRIKASQFHGDWNYTISPRV